MKDSVEYHLHTNVHGVRGFLRLRLLGTLHTCSYTPMLQHPSLELPGGHRNHGLHCPWSWPLQKWITQDHRTWGLVVSKNTVLWPVSPAVSQTSYKTLVRIPLYLFNPKNHFKIYPVSFPCGLYWYLKQNSRIPLWWSPGCRFPGCIVIWVWSLPTRQLTVVWLLTGTPEQRYWQNRDTANIGLDNSVGRAPAR